MSTSMPPPAAGIIPVDKPAGPTSHDLVAQLRRLLSTVYPLTPRTIKAGHAGTLDPFATGLLLLVFGYATRLIEYTAAWPKTYLVTIHLGATSDTDDSTGKITPLTNKVVFPPKKGKVEEVLQYFTGSIQQIPPTYSAKKISGRRLYQIARESSNPAQLKQLAGEKTSLVIIHSLKIISYAYPDLTLEVVCGSGTYLRSLARDLGEALGTGAYAAKLQRIQIGPIDINQAIHPDEINSENLAQYVLPPDILIHNLPKLTASPANVAQLLKGQPMEWGITPTNETFPSLLNQPIAIYNPDNQLTAIAHLDPATSLLHPLKNLHHSG